MIKHQSTKYQSKQVCKKFLKIVLLQKNKNIYCGSLNVPQNLKFRPNT